MDEPVKAPEDRRNAPRHFACFPARIARAETGDGRSALISDLSVTGALLMTRARLAVDQPVALTLYLSEDAATARSASGRVVRIERRPASSDVWAFDIAVEFDQPLVDIEDEVRSIEARQAGSFMAKVRKRSTPPAAGS